MHLIAWDMVTLRRREGGLGIKDLHLMRFALQGKRIMHYLNRLENLWVQVVRAKYGLISLSRFANLRNVVGVGISVFKLSLHFVKDFSVPLRLSPTFVDVSFYD